jgi:hypothetical protein
MYCSNLSCKFSRQTQKKLVGFSHYGHFRIMYILGGLRLKHIYLTYFYNKIYSADLQWCGLAVTPT